MKSQVFSDREAWLDARMGPDHRQQVGLTIGKRDGKPKKGYWELIAEKVALPPNGKNVMERNSRNRANSTTCGGWSTSVTKGS